MKQAYEVVIVGGGIVGLTAAGLLAQDEHLAITIIDAGRKPQFDPARDLSLRVSAIAPGSVEVLRTIGAWQEIARTRACPYRAMKVWDASGNAEGPETLSFGADEFALPQLGFIVENALVQAALVNQLATSGVEQRFDTPIKRVSRTGRRLELELESGEVLSPDLLVGADGASSLVRNSAGIDVDSWAHAQKAFVTCLRPALSHRNTAWQRFTADGPIGLLPLLDGRISIVWSTTPGQADDALSMADDALAARLQEVTDGVLGALEPAGPRGAFPLQSQHARSYVQDGLALIGDAAHTVHPLAGQGVNLGIADAQALAQAISSALLADENPGDLPALRRYERSRKGANQAMLHFTNLLNKLFSNESASLARLRGVGMYAFNHAGPVRDQAVQIALGIR